MALKRPKDETRVTSPTAGDALLLDGATTRSIVYSDLVRIPLAVNTTVYVNPATGSDTLNNGLSALAPFATIQKACDVVGYLYDQRGFTATIQLADGNYTDPVLITGGAPYVIVGNNATPANIVHAAVGACNFKVRNAKLTISGMELRNLVGGFVELLADHGGDITFTSMRFGATDGDQLQASGGKIHGSGAYSIVGNMGSHGHARYRGLIDIDSAVCTLPAGVAIANYFFGINDASVHFTNSSFAGAGAGTGSTGVRALIHNSANFDSNGVFTLTSLPGNAAVQLDASGRYDSSFVGDGLAFTPYVPTVTSSTPGGTPATYTVNRARYKIAGKRCLVIVDVTVANQGIGAAGDIVIDLPFPSLYGAPGSSYEYSLTGKSGRAFVSNGVSVMRLRDATSTTYIATGNGIMASVEYELA